MCCLYISLFSISLQKNIFQHSFPFLCTFLTNFSMFYYVNLCWKCVRSVCICSSWLTPSSINIVYFLVCYSSMQASTTQHSQTLLWYIYRNKNTFCLKTKQPLYFSPPTIIPEYIFAFNLSIIALKHFWPEAYLI